MKKLITILCTTIVFQSFAQTVDIEFGKLTEEELKMQHYEKDEEAKAVVLYDKGKSIFYKVENGYNIRFTRHKRIKIFDKNESQHAEVSIPFYVDGYGKTEEVKSIRASTYNYEDGKLTQSPLNPSNVYEEQINERWRVKKFTFPDLQDGSILEFQYILETPFHFNLPDWIFQDRIPTIYSEYEVSMIPFYEYAFLVQGVSKFDYKNSVVSKDKRTWGEVSMVYGRNMGSGVEFQDYTHTYVLKDIPAFRDEAYISSIEDYIIKMDFQLAKFLKPTGGTSNIISTWPELNDDLLKHEDFGRYLKKSGRAARNIIDGEIDLTGLESSAKAEKIITYVKEKFEWNGNYSKYASQSPDDLIDKKIGNSADINLFLIALLTEAEVDAQPVILSTRNHGIIPVEYPFMHFTNYVIAMVNTESAFLTDATEDYLPFNRIPPRCLNEKGLIVNESDNPQWISLKNNIPSLEKKIINLTLDTTSLNVNTMVSIQSTSYESYTKRVAFKDDTTKIKEYYEDKIGNINKALTYGFDKLERPYALHFKGEFETDKIGDAVVIYPFLKLPISKNKLTQKERSYPIDFTNAWEDEFESKLTIPEGYSITSLPEGYQLDNELAEINLNCKYENGIVVSNGVYKFKKATYSPSEYARIKYYFDEIVKYFNQPIVIETSE
ncbi:DUF3857 domain-containing protein [Ekhidna sp.]|uniref:DUF3857 domain-containing protein n=1 Tax=Ekhidna sp. TaxID=2608089 RepID=UPI003B5BC1DB